MFGLSIKKGKKRGPEPSYGAAEVLFCVFDDHRKLVHCFVSDRKNGSGADAFRFLNEPERAFDYKLMRDAIETYEPTSLTLVHGDGSRKCLYVIPYEKKRDKWRFACFQVCKSGSSGKPDDDTNLCMLAEDRFCLLLTDEQYVIRAASARIPKAFGYTVDQLVGVNLDELFSRVDLEVIGACSPDTNETILSCVFFCLDGSRREIEIRKYSAPDRLTLYALSDMTQPGITEDLSQAITRERRRIGQDLHDSIGQILTGISLLSRSLANSLKRVDSVGEIDALQISALADDASNQIRQISRGLMPSEVVHKGLFESLRELARNTAASCGMECQARLDESIEFADGAVETHLYRIAQEAVTNAVKHAGASRIDVVIAQEGGIPYLEIIDNGNWKGDADDGMHGMGMQTMEYRASAIGAHLRVDAGSLDGGTRVVCMLEVDELAALDE